MAPKSTVKDVEEVTRSTKARMGFSNILVALLNFLLLLCSLALIGIGIWIAIRHRRDCLRFFLWPVIAVGLFFFVFSLIAIIGAMLRIKILVWFHLAVALLIIVALLGIVGFAFFVTTKGSGEEVNGKAYDDYYLKDYSKWMQHELRRRSNWAKIKRCIQDRKVCQKLNYDSPNNFFNADLSPLQSGCCKPPTACNFTFVTATSWKLTSDSSIASEADCKTWNNDSAELCYECDSCRAAIAETTRRAWNKVAVTCAVILVFLIVDYSLACCAARNDKNRFLEKRKVTKSSTETGYKEKRKSVIRE